MTELFVDVGAVESSDAQYQLRLNAQTGKPRRSSVIEGRYPRHSSSDNHDSAHVETGEDRLEELSFVAGIATQEALNETITYGRHV